MKATIMGYIGIIGCILGSNIGTMEKKMDTTILSRGNLRVIYKT